MKKRYIVTILLIVFAVAINIGLFLRQPDYSAELVRVEVDIASSDNLSAQLFYTQDKYYSETQSITADYTADSNANTLSFDFPADSKWFRFDPAREGGVELTITGVRLVYNGAVISEYSVDDAELSELESSGNGKLVTNSEDAYMVFAIDSTAVMNAVQTHVQKTQLIMSIIECVVIDLIILLVLFKWTAVIPIPKEIWYNRKLTLNLAKNDFKNRFSGSYLGTVWAFVQPVVTILLFWFVFEKGLHAGPQGLRNGIPVPFVLWLTSGLVPWFFFQDALISGTNTLYEYAFLVKKVVFNIGILPAVKVISNLFVHVAFVGFMFILYILMGLYPTVYSVQVIYYSIAMICFVTGLVYLTSAFCVFFKDLAQIISILMQVFMWSTPIMWNINAIGLKGPLLYLFKLNPMFYIVQGYRDSMIDCVWFFEKSDLTVYFWAVTILLFVFGTTMFRKLKIHFADVL